MNKTDMINPLFCDIETGMCEVPEQQSEGSDITIKSEEKKIRILYFTDPICSSCWGIEPQLRKLKLEYGHAFDIEYRMGGLLSSWNAYGGSDVSNPADVAKHWEEAGAYYDMPIDGDMWLEDPLDSSYPPSIAFKAAQIQSEEKALVFLRRIKEMIFLEKKNIARWEHIKQAALESNLDAEQLKTDIAGQGKELFDQDLELKKQLGVRGFPSIFFTDKEGNRFLVYGSKPYEQYEQALLKLYPDAKKQPYDTSPESLFDQYPTLTLKEFSTLANKSKNEAETLLNDLLSQGLVNKYASKNGDLWIKK